MFWRLFSFILVTGLFVLTPAYFLIENDRERHQYDHWEVIACTITDISYKRKDLYIDYKYYYQGTLYTTNAAIGHRGHFKLQKIHKKYSALVNQENKAECYVNPDYTQAYRSYLVLPLPEAFNKAWIYGLSLVALFFYYLIYKSTSLAKLEKQLRKKYPKQAWKWRAEWESGIIKSSIFEETSGLLTFTMVWFGFTVFAYSIISTIITCFVMPLIGCVFLYKSLIPWMKMRRSSGALFHIENERGIRGGELLGELELPHNIIPEGVIVVRLSCDQFVYTGGRHKGMKVQVLWLEQYEVKATEFHTENGRYKLPIDFEIPLDLPNSDTHRKAIRNRWRLEVKMKVQDFDFIGNFEVPVFK